MGILSGDAAGFIMFYPMDCISYADSIGIQPRLDLETSDPSSNHQIVNGLVLLEKHVYIIFLTISIYIYNHAASCQASLKFRKMAGLRIFEGLTKMYRWAHWRAPSRNSW